MPDMMVARQPILDANQDLHAYELLYRPAPDAMAAADGDAATARVMMTSLVEMGLENVVGSVPAFVNMTRALILSETIQLLPPDRVVLELLEHIRIDGPLFAAVKRLTAGGYRFALDDFLWRDDLEPVIELCDYVKLDLRQLNAARLNEYTARLKGRRPRLIAEKVETQEEVDLCLKLGISLFQGYFFCRPRVMSNRALSPTQNTLLALVSRLQDPDVPFNDLAKVVQGDVGLTHKLLRIINSAFYSLPRKVESVKDALVLLGLRTVRRWASLIALAGLGKIPREGFTAALVRARTCELLAERSRQHGADTHFMAGLLSTLGDLLGSPLEEVIADLPLSESLRAALLTGEGDLGAAIACATAHETAQWEAMRYRTLTPGQIRDAYIQAVTWAADVNEQLKG